MSGYDNTVSKWVNGHIGKGRTCIPHSQVPEDILGASDFDGFPVVEGRKMHLRGYVTRKDLFTAIGMG